METVAPISCAKQESVTGEIDGGAPVAVLPAYGNLLENLECFQKTQRARLTGEWEDKGQTTGQNERMSRQVKRQPDPAVYMATTHHRDSA